MSTSREERLPSRRVPLLYFGTAYVCLLTALALVALRPHSVLGFYYHPWMLFVVHLATVGWITSSILGALYLVGPMALRTPMPTGKADARVFYLYAFGATGIIFHFLIQEFSGLGFSGLIVLFCVAWVSRKTLVPLLATTGKAAPAPAVKLHFVLAFANFAVAATTGSLIGFDKFHNFLPGYRMAYVEAHAHLAALGWATMMVMAAGYRLLPMFLPSKMPAGPSLLINGLVYETGLLVLFVSLLVRSDAGTRAGAVLTVTGIAGFFAHVVWMKLHPLPPARGLPRPDLGIAQALLAIAYLGVSAGLGLYLAFQETSELTLRLTTVYGVTALLGFLAQMIAGVSVRLLPIFAWMTAFTTGDDGERLPPEKTPHDLVHRPARAVSFVLWLLGVPALASGFYLENAALTSAAGTALFVAVGVAAAGHVKAFRAAG